MTRFDAATRPDRSALIEAGIGAHRERGSAFCTFEPDRDDVPDVDEYGVPWVQCSGAETTFDCTPAELDRAKELLESYRRYRIDAIHRPDEAAGANVTVTTPGERSRRAEFIDELFTVVFELPADYRLWACAI